VLLVTSTASFLTPFMGASLNVAIPTIGRDLGASALSLNWIVTAYLIASAALLLPFGRIADLAGRKWLFVAGALVQAGFSAGCALAPSAGSLIVLRALQGVGGAIGFATGVAMLVSAFPPAERGRVLGISTAAVYAGLSLGPVLGGLVTQHLGWRAIFVIAAVLGLVVATLTMVAVRGEWRAEHAGSLDLAGAIGYTLAIMLLMGGVATLHDLPAARWMVLAGASGMVGFLVHEGRVADPLLDLRLFSSAVFAFSNLAALIHYSATFACTFLMSLYLQAVKGLDPQGAGLILLAQPVMMALLSPVAGRLSDRVEPRIVASLGMALSALALAVFATFGDATPLVAVVGGLLLMGIGFGLFSSPNANAVMGAVDRKNYGVGSATLGTMRLVGQALSMAVVALILAHFMGAARVEKETAGPLLASTRWAFTSFAVLCALGVLASLARGKVNRYPPGGLTRP
jgi:EmrB/QacA subfamily drug resistance transporter